MLFVKRATMTEPLSENSSLLCPVCAEKPIDTAALMLWGSGLIVTYRFLHRRLVGCNSCVRRQLRQRAAHSALVGWLSLPALLINPFLVLYNLFRGLTVRADPERVARTFQKLGLSTDGSPSLASAGHALAAAMIAADGLVDPGELKVARSLGPRRFDGFDPDQLEELVASSRELPSARDLAQILRHVLTEEERTALFSFLYSIARADGQVSADERLLLKPVARNLGIDLDHWMAQVRGHGT